MFIENDNSLCSQQQAIKAFFKWDKYPANFNNLILWSNKW